VLIPALLQDFFQNLESGTLSGEDLVRTESHPEAGQAKIVDFQLLKSNFTGGTINTSRSHGKYLAHKQKADIIEFRK
jgi:hypothetical protein